MTEPKLIRCVNSECCLGDTNCWYGSHTNVGSKTYLDMDEALACHAASCILKLVKKYEEHWRCRPPSVTLNAHTSVKNMMIKFIDCMHQSEFTAEAIFKFVIRYLSENPSSTFRPVKKSDIKRCITLPKIKVSTKPEISDDELVRDKQLFNEKCSLLFNYTHTNKLFM